MGGSTVRVKWITLGPWVYTPRIKSVELLRPSLKEELQELIVALWRWLLMKVPLY